MAKSDLFRFKFHPPPRFDLTNSIPRASCRNAPTEKTNGSSTSSTAAWVWNQAVDAQSFSDERYPILRDNVRQQRKRRRGLFNNGVIFKRLGYLAACTKEPFRFSALNCCLEILFHRAAFQLDPHLLGQFADSAHLDVGAER